jgi:hypothetical protein
MSRTVEDAVGVYVDALDHLVEQGEGLKEAKRIAMAIAVSSLDEMVDQQSWEPLLEEALAARMHRRTLAAHG